MIGQNSRLAAGAGLQTAFKLAACAPLPQMTAASAPVPAAREVGSIEAPPRVAVAQKRRYVGAPVDDGWESAFAAMEGTVRPVSTAEEIAP